MSLATIETEVHRFLSTDTPEVLCIKGKWGVGKTYGWKKFLNDAKATKTLAFSQYSYVSLFGLNSLDDLRFAIFERTTSDADIGKNADSATFQKFLSKGSDFGRRLRPLAEALATVVNRKGLVDVLAKSAFLSVQNQLICLDDLERSGSALKIRDVLGLTSFLKEERHCKVVLLLNDEEHEERKEFNKQLEKVADVTLTFTPTAEEAAKIALRDDNQTTSLLQTGIIELGITNIRVIKKLEVLSGRLAEVLDGFSASVLNQAISTLTLAGWCVYQPGIAPPLAFVRAYNQIARAMRSDKEDVDEETSKWLDILDRYPFKSADELDLLIMDGVVSGYFVADEIREKAEKVQKQHRRHSRDTMFSRAWDEFYHGSLSVEDDQFLDLLYRGAMDEADSISALNINSAIRLLRECGREYQADEVIQNWFAVHADEQLEFFNIANHHFSEDDPVDVEFRAAFEERRRNFQDSRNPLEVLQRIGREGRWREADVALMAKQSVADFEKMFEELRGSDVHDAVEVILRIGKTREEGSQLIKTATIEALRRIAAKSPLRARKIRRFGIEVEPAVEQQDSDGT